MSRRGEEGVRRWSEEQLLEWLLDDRRRDEFPREVLERDPEVATRLAELESFLHSCRSSLAAEAKAELEADAHDGLVERILASTTREDLSWRGDLRLVGGFLRQRLRSSRLLRLVAASLLLHVVALPVLAYYTLFVASEQQTVIRFAPQPGELPYAEPEREPERQVQEPFEELDVKQLLGDRLERAGLVAHGAFTDLPENADLWSDPLALVLWCEVLMDDLEAPEPAEGSLQRLHFALGELEEILEAPGDRGALGRLAASAWLRASEGGWSRAEPRLWRKHLAGGSPLTSREWARSYREAGGE